MDAPQNEKKKNDDRQRNADQKKEGAPFHGFPPKRETRAPFKAEAAPAAAVRKDKTVRLGTAPKRGKFLPARSAWVARLIIRYFDVGQTGQVGLIERRAVDCAPWSGWGGKIRLRGMCADYPRKIFVKFRPLAQ